ncbi:MAG: OmpA/MotB family protein [Planctomycetota bacterium]
MSSSRKSPGKRDRGGALWRASALLAAAAAAAAGCVQTVAVDQEAIDEELTRLRMHASNVRVMVSSTERQLRVVRAKLAISERKTKEMDRAAKELRSRGIAVSPRGPALVVALADRVLFPSGEAELRAGATEELGKIAKVLKEGLPARPISIEGHTDSVPPKKTAARYPTNRHLSMARAVAVARYLVEKAGIDPKRVSATGFADTRPLGENDTTDGRAANRRVEIVVLPPIGIKHVSAKLD